MVASVEALQQVVAFAAEVAASEAVIEEATVRVAGALAIKAEEALAAAEVVTEVVLPTAMGHLQMRPQVQGAVEVPAAAVGMVAL